ncbi:MAG: TetR/AcrR family transcriptional regulator [FCB group bacterium]|nr:TetR/AcrR family transcriptional regulator [FCB group bacterium]
MNLIDYTDRQKQIIQASVQLIAQKGIQGLTIKNISRAIGISEPAIYRHFENKNDIILGIISLLKDSTSDNTAAESEKNSTFDAINAMFHGLTDRFVKNPSLTAIIFSEEIFNNNSLLATPVRKMVKRNQDKLIAIIEKGRAMGEIRSDISARQLSNMIIGSFRFLVSKWHLTKFEFDLTGEAEELLNSLEIVLKP